MMHFNDLDCSKPILDLDLSYLDLHSRTEQVHVSLEPGLCLQHDVPEGEATGVVGVDFEAIA